MSAKVRLHSVASSKRKRPAWRYQRAKLVQLPDDLLGDTVASLLDLASHVALACCCWNLNAILSLCLKAPGVCLTTPTCGLRARKYVSKMPKWALGWPAAEKFKWFNSLQTLVITDDSHIDRIIATLVGSFLHRTLPTMPQNLRELHVNFAGYVEFGEFFESLKGCRRNLLSLHLAVDIASSTACDSVTFGLLQRGSFFKNLTSFRFNVRQQLHRDFSLDRARTRLLFLSMPNLTHLECEGRFDDLVPECFPALKHLHLSERDPVSEPVTDHDPKVLDLRACTALDTVIFTEREFEVGIYILPVSVRRVHIYDAVTQFVNPSILPNLENFEILFHYLSDEEIGFSLAFLAASSKLRSIVLHPRITSGRITSEIRNWLQKLQRDTTILPNLELLVIAGDEGDEWYGSEGTDPDLDEWMDEQIFLGVCNARPHLHMFIRLYQSEFDSHRYDDSPIVKSQAGDPNHVRWVPFISRDTPPHTAERFYWSSLSSGV